MNTAEIKLDIINKIYQIKEDYFIEDFKNMLEFELSTEIYITNNEIKDRIRLSKEEYKNGKTITEEVANREIDEWRRK